MIHKYINGGPIHFFLFKLLTPHNIYTHFREKYQPILDNKNFFFFFLVPEILFEGIFGYKTVRLCTTIENNRLP